MIGSIKYIIVTLCVLSIAIGLFVCLAYWYRRRSVVGRYYSCSRGILAKKDSRGGFWKSMNAFLDGVESLQVTAKAQRELEELEIIRRILYGGYGSEEEIAADFGALGKALPAADGYYVMVFQYEDPKKEDAGLTNRRFSEEVRANFSACVSGMHWLYELSHLTFVLILADSRELGAAGVKREAERINYYFYKDRPLSIFTGISRRADSLMQLEQAYEEAQSVSAYVRFFEIRLPLLREEMPESTESFFFPIDVEMQLEQTILHGSAQELEALLEEIREYYLKGSAKLSMLQYYLELLRGVAMRAAQKLEQGERERVCRLLCGAQTQEEIFGGIRLLQSFLLKHQEQSEKEERRKQKRYFEEIVEERYADAGFNLAEFADIIKTPQRRLYREFAECMGITFSDYLEKVRIHNACALLKQGMAVKDVAARTGYGSDYSFRRAFKRVIGMAPSEYQKNIW